MFKSYIKKVKDWYEVECALCGTVLRTENPSDFKWTGGYSVQCYCTECGMPISVPIRKLKAKTERYLIQKSGGD